jgi:TPP-dependent 2-oxoacid decarboxylase
LIPAEKFCLAKAVIEQVLESGRPRLLTVITRVISASVEKNPKTAVNLKGKESDSKKEKECPNSGANILHDYLKYLISLVLVG